MARRTFRISRRTDRVVGYIRVSTDQQAESGLGLEDQRAKLGLVAQLHKLNLASVVVDAGESAKDLDRPGLQRVLLALRRGNACGVLVVKLDRLTRSVGDMAALYRDYFYPGGADLFTVDGKLDTSSATGRMTSGAQTLFSQYEREVIGERTAAALAQKRSRGEYCGGGAPYGYQLSEDGKRILVHPRETDTVSRAKVLRAHGMTLRAISARLASAGRLNRSGRPFSAVQVRRMVG